MDNFMGKIQEMLSDPESMQQLNELAAMLKEEIPSDSAAASATATQTGDNANPFGDFDFSKLLQLQGMLGSMQGSDKNADLLLALRPHVSEARQEKIDRAVKLLRLYAMWIMLRESGMLKELL